MIFALLIASLFDTADATTCRDGTYSASVGRGTCSWHGGVASYDSYVPPVSAPPTIAKPRNDSPYIHTDSGVDNDGDFYYSASTGNDAMAMITYKCYKVNGVVGESLSIAPDLNASYQITEPQFLDGDDTTLRVYFISGAAVTKLTGWYLRPLVINPNTTTIVLSKHTTYTDIGAGLSNEEIFVVKNSTELIVLTGPKPDRAEIDLKGFSPAMSKTWSKCNGLK